MKTLLFVAALAATIAIVPASQAKAQGDFFSAEEILNICKLLLEQATSDCTFYILGVIGGLRTMAHWKGSRKTICPPQPVSGNDMREAFLHIWLFTPISTPLQHLL